MSQGFFFLLAVLSVVWLCYKSDFQARFKFRKDRKLQRKSDWTNLMVWRTCFSGTLKSKHRQTGSVAKTDVCDLFFKDLAFLMKLFLYFDSALILPHYDNDKFTGIGYEHVFLLLFFRSRTWMTWMSTWLFHFSQMLLANCKEKTRSSAANRHRFRLVGELVASPNWHKSHLTMFRLEALSFFTLFQKRVYLHTHSTMIVENPLFGAFGALWRPLFWAGSLQ